MISCSLFGGSCVSSTFHAIFITSVFFVVLVLSPLQKSNCLFWVCLSTFWCFVLRLKSSLQKNNLSGSKLVLIQFGYRGFSFLSHAVWL